MIKDESENMLQDFATKSMAFRITLELLRETYALGKSVVK
jgi:hypothetical protein